MPRGSAQPEARPRPGSQGLASRSAAELQGATGARGEHEGSALAETKPAITGTTLPFDKLSPDQFERLCPVSYTHLTLPTIFSG